MFPIQISMGSPIIKVVGQGRVRGFETRFDCFDSPELEQLLNAFDFG